MGRYPLLRSKQFMPSLVLRYICLSVGSRGPILRAHSALTGYPNSGGAGATGDPYGTIMRTSDPQPTFSLSAGLSRYVAFLSMIPLFHAWFLLRSFKTR